MGVYEQLSDDDQRAVSQLAKYLVETEGNRFYDQPLITVRNHIAGNHALVVEARRFQKKIAEVMAQQALALAAISKQAEIAASNPVQQMMQRYQDTSARTAFLNKVDATLKQRSKKKSGRGFFSMLKPNRG